jgi:hypothetical protein
VRAGREDWEIAVNVLSGPARKECCTRLLRLETEIPALENASHDWLAVWRVAGLLAGRLDQASAVVARDAGARHQTRPRVNRAPRPAAGSNFRINRYAVVPNRASQNDARILLYQPRPPFPAILETARC